MNWKKIYNIKKVCPIKTEPQQQGIFYLKKRAWLGGQAGQQGGIFKVRLGLGEIEGRNRET